LNINFQALGCRLNEAELESWATQFLQSGHQVTTDPTDADMVIFNSCSVTAAADRKSRQQINRLHRDNPDARLVVTGCHASLNPESVKNHLGVDMVVDNNRKDNLVEDAIEYFDLETNHVADQTINSLFLRGRHRAFIKVQDGCRYRCTYCIVTIARGDERSRAPEDILAEIKRIHSQGINEIVITGVHVGGYGSDIGSNLYRLLADILEFTNIPRIRLASVEPWDLPDQFFDLFTDTRLMPHMHLPIQSGCDSVLRRMARRCKTAEFNRIVDKAREAVPLFNITTDLITGFPGETEDEWRQTMQFIEQIDFGHMHIFPFSPRSGTKAARLPDQINKSVKKARSSEMHILARELKRRTLQRHVDSMEEVLWEQCIGENQSIWQGYTRHYHKVSSHQPEATSGSVSSVELKGISEDGLFLTSRQAELESASIYIDALTTGNSRSGFST
jgi:threonylcarbamoyladenosine tRNA methylthiotransferase MtaB